MKKQVFGDEEIRFFFRNFPKKVTDRVVKTAAKEPAWLLAKDASARLQRSQVFRRHGTDGGYSKLLHTASSIQPKNLKHGVAVQPSWKQTDVFVKGSSRPRWTTWGWANLLMKGRGGGGGSWRTRTASGSGGGIDTSTGTTRGAGDYVQAAANGPIGQLALRNMRRNLNTKMDALARRMINKQKRLAA